MQVAIPEVRARCFLRKMRGGTQAHLIEADDNNYYVVKFTNNPQGIRVLINEFISSCLLQEMGIFTPRIAGVQIDRDFLAAHPDAYLSTPGITPPACGLHFGSQYPGPPGTSAVYDFLPEVMFRRLYNRSNFCGVLVFDKWISNGNGRQAIFFRARPASVECSQDAQWFAQAIDNGHAFQGVDWTFRDSPVQGVYARRAIYGRHVSMLKMWPWIERAANVRRDVFADILAALPASWIARQEHAVKLLLRELYERRRLLPELVREWIAWMHRSRPESSREMKIWEFA